MHSYVDVPPALAHLKPGDRVRIRGGQWRVARWIGYGESAVIEAVSLDAIDRGVAARFLLPCEPLELLPSPTLPRIVRSGRWRHVARATLAAATPSSHAFRCAARAAIDLIPFQLEPALAVTSGRGCRLLIADEVGLGKTVQAGLVIAETLAREPDARALVICPAGLRRQWRQELSERFDLDASLLDAATARTGGSRDAGANPWTATPIGITSIDYIKRPEVMRAVEPLVWDIIVFDEAHGLSGSSDRAAAAALLASRARRLVMLTATPHSGDEEGFQRLCQLGQLSPGEPLLLFRRTRSQAGVDTRRRTVMLKVRPTPAERAMHDALVRYTERVSASEHGMGARLVIEVLLRRASSSAAALARSLERRIALLASDAPPGMQPRLPFIDQPDSSDDEPAGILAAPGLDDTSEECALLEDVLRLARSASLRESKSAALLRLLRRIGEPALIFTEYRDTLVHLAAQLPANTVQLHGGMTLAEREQAARRFTGGAATLMLATDAASEGLNLHQRCRAVITLELPWTPVRLEQRIGRVDRIGQHRTVHAVHLVAAGTTEERIAARLAIRRATASRALEPLRGSSALQLIDLRAAAQAEADRVGLARVLSDRSMPAADARPVAAIVKSRRRQPRAVWVWRLPLIDARGRLMWDALAAVGARPMHLMRRRSVARTALDEALIDDRLLDREERRNVALLVEAMRQPIAMLEQRERLIRAAIDRQQGRMSAALLQGSLFDRRGERATAAQRALLRDAMAVTDARLLELDSWRRPRSDGRMLVFAVALQ